MIWSCLSSNICLLPLPASFLPAPSSTHRSFSLTLLARMTWRRSWSWWRLRARFWTQSGPVCSTSPAPRSCPGRPMSHSLYLASTLLDLGSLRTSSVSLCAPGCRWSCRRERSRLLCLARSVRFQCNLRRLLLAIRGTPCLRKRKLSLLYQCLLARHMFLLSFNLLLLDPRLVSL